MYMEYIFRVIKQEIAKSLCQQVYWIAYFTWLTLDLRAVCMITMYIVKLL